jgi:hypothetical protein
VPAKVLVIPLAGIEPHPRLTFRFSYDVASLADSIRSSADQNAPNGQLNPGRVVRKSGEEGYYVYIGVRRFLALKLLHQQTGDERFRVYNAYLDEGLSDLQMFVRAKAENEEERGERQGLSILEQASGLLKIRDSVNPEELEGGLKRLFRVADRLGDERLKKLYDVERASRTKFRLSQLESLCTVEGEKEFYTTAASAAGFGVDDVEFAEKSREAAYHLDWFPKIFPDYKEEGAKSETKQQVEGERGNTSTIQQLEAHEEGVVVANCPRCGGGNMLRIEGEIDVTHLSQHPGGERETKVADAILTVAFHCSHCRLEFYVFARHMEGKTYAISSGISERFREPEEEVDAADLRFNFEENTWEMIVDGKVAGSLQLAAGKSNR